MTTPTGGENVPPPEQGTLVDSTATPPSDAQEPPGFHYENRSVIEYERRRIVILAVYIAVSGVVALAYMLTAWDSGTDAAIVSLGGTCTVQDVRGPYHGVCWKMNDTCGDAWLVTLRSVPDTFPEPINVSEEMIVWTRFDNDQSIDCWVVRNSTTAWGILIKDPCEPSGSTQRREPIVPMWKTLLFISLLAASAFAGNYIAYIKRRGQGGLRPPLTPQGGSSVPLGPPRGIRVV